MICGNTSDFIDHTLPKTFCTRTRGLPTTPGPQAPHHLNPALLVSVQQQCWPQKELKNYRKPFWIFCESNSCSKLFKVYLDKPWNYQWYCYQKTPLPLVGSLLKDKGSMLPLYPLSGVHGVTLRNKVRSCEIRKALNVEPLLRIERSQVHCFGHVSRKSH